MKKTKRFISLFLSVFILVSITAGIDFSASAETTGSQIAAYAKIFKGCSYKYAARGPKCFDCSGFVYYVFNHFGFTVPTSSDGYSNPSKYGTKITGDSNAKLGDIVVWSDHLGIYIGDGKVINSLNSSKGVCETVIKDFVNLRGVKNPSHYYLRVKGVYETITNPSVTIKSPSSLTSSSVKLNFTVNNPSKITVKSVGIQVRKKGTSTWKTKQKTVASANTKSSSISASFSVGSGKDLNLSLTSATTYEYRAYSVYDNKYFYSSVNTFTTAIIIPSVTVNSVTNLSTDSAKLNFTVKNPSKLAINTIGVQIREKGSSEWFTKQEAMKSGNVNASAVSLSWIAGQNQDLNMPLKSGTTYEYKAYVIYNNGYYYSSASTFTTKSAAVQPVKAVFANAVMEADEAIQYEELKAPTLKVKVNTNGSFTLSWNAVADAEKYEIFIKNTDGSYKILKTTTATSFTTAVAAYGKSYTYKVRAVRTIDSQNCYTSDYSSTVSAVNNKKLQTPTLKATVNSTGSFKLSWNAITGATSYKLYLKNADGTYKLLKTTTATSFTTAVAAYGKSYTYKVLAVKGSVTSAYSATVSAKNAKKLQTPSGVKAVTNKNGSFTISWNKITGANKYQVYILDSKTNKYRLLKTTTSNKITTGVAAKGKTYKYKVRALTSKNSSATSAYSSVLSKKR